jgi:hypothetical protein
MLQNLIRWLMPDERRFFDHVVTIAETSVAAARKLGELPTAPNRAAQLAVVDEIKAAEKAGDDALRTLMTALDDTYVTPIDREDLYTLGALPRGHQRHRQRHRVAPVPAQHGDAARRHARPRRPPVEGHRAVPRGRAPAPRRAGRDRDPRRVQGDRRARVRGRPAVPHPRGARCSRPSATRSCSSSTRSSSRASKTPSTPAPTWARSSKPSSSRTADDHPHAARPRRRRRGDLRLRQRVPRHRQRHRHRGVHGRDARAQTRS